MNPLAASFTSGLRYIAMTDLSQLEMRIMRRFLARDRALEFVKPGAIVQLGEDCDGTVFEVQRVKRDTVLVKNVETGVESAISIYDIWPGSPLSALGKQANG